MLEPTVSFGRNSYRCVQIPHRISILMDRSPHRDPASRILALSTETEGVSASQGRGFVVEHETPEESVVRSDHALDCESSECLRRQTFPLASIDRCSANHVFDCMRQCRR
jgi:hypothetical protein